MNWKALTSAVLVFCWGPFAANLQAARLIPAPRARLTKYDWSVSASRNLARNPPSMREVKEFARSLEIFVWGEAMIGGGNEICSFTFVNLRGDGYLSLVYGAGRPSCSDVYIVDRIGSSFEMYWGSGEAGAGSEVSRLIRDLRNDGKLELVIYRRMGALPQRCVAEWPTIYAWTGANYTNVSNQFKDFYRQQLDSINNIIPTLQAVPRANRYTLSDKECLEAEKSALQRFLDISPDAGIEQAERLATSDDRNEREFATELLAQFDTPEARKYLVKLSKENDWTISTYAKKALAGNPKRRQSAYDSFSPQ